MLMLAITWGGNQFPWDSASILCLLIFSVVGFVLFIHNERYATLPVLNVRLFLNRTFSIGCLGFVFTGMSLFSCLTFLAVYFQESQHTSAIGAGVRTLPYMFGIVVAVVVSGRYIARTGRYRFFPCAGMAVNTVGVGLLSLLDQENNYGFLFFAMLVAGLGLGCVISTVMVAVQNAVARADMASATSGVGFMRTLGGSIGLAIYGAVLNSTSSGSDPSARGTHFIMLWTVLPCGLAAIAFFFLPSVSLQTTSAIASSRAAQSAAKQASDASKEVELGTIAVVPADATKAAAASTEANVPMQSPDSSVTNNASNETSAEVELNQLSTSRDAAFSARESDHHANSVTEVEIPV
jgi:Na+/melibiose symporter-like transporter